MRIKLLDFLVAGLLCVPGGAFAAPQCPNNYTASLGLSSAVGIKYECTYDANSNIKTHTCECPPGYSIRTFGNDCWCEVCEGPTYQDATIRTNGWNVTSHPALPIAKSCTACPAGFFIQYLDATHHTSINDCTICPMSYLLSNTTTVTGGKAYECTTANQFLQPTIHVCVCRAGYFNAGMFMDISGGTPVQGCCTVCPQHEYSDTESSSGTCMACPAGTGNSGTLYTDHDNPNDCKILPCPANQYGAGGTNCTACPKFTDVNGKSIGGTTPGTALNTTVANCLLSSPATNEFQNESGTFVITDTCTGNPG